MGVKDKTLDISKVFADDASEMIFSREKCIAIHGSGDLVAAGNEVEIPIRDYFSKRLPHNVYVTNGHLIDRNGRVSNQFDIIITDRSKIASLYTASDGTNYVPIEVVMAVGEIKSTYYESQEYIKKYSDSIKRVKADLKKEILWNTTWNGKITEKSLFRDININSENKVLNEIFFFMIFVNGGDFRCDNVMPLYKSIEDYYLPNTIVMLDKGIVAYGNIHRVANYYAYPEHDDFSQYRWFYHKYIVEETGNGTIEGNHLAYLYHELIRHIANSYVENPNVTQYIESMMNFDFEEKVEFEK